MKKISVLLLCCLTAAGAMAQESVVKAAEKAQKSGKPFTEVVEIMTPAFSDPTTAKSVDTYYIPGKAAFTLYDKYLGLQQTGMGKPEEIALMPSLLLGGFEYYNKALPFDSVPDAKGKIKTKRSKEIFSTLGAHHNDLINGGLNLYNDKNYAGAYELWDYYVSMPSDPRFKGQITNVPADSTRAEIAFNMGLAAYNTQDYKKSLNAFMRAKDLGYTEKVLFDYAISVATMIEDQEAVNQMAKAAIPLYGKEDSNYVGYLINGYIKSQDYAGGIKVIDEAIQNDPNNGQYYVIKGILVEEAGNGDPKALYNKAMEVDPHNSQALYHSGRMIYNEAIELNNNAPNDEAEYSKFFVTQFKPLMLQAVDLFEQSVNIKEDNRDALKLLEQAYYLLNDESNLNYTRERLNQ